MSFRNDYMTIRFLEKTVKEMGFDKGVVEAMCKEYKQKIRHANKAMEECPVWHYRSDDIDSGRYCKEVYDWIFTAEEKEEYLSENRWYIPYGDGRDCTGKWFTSYITIIPVPSIGKTIVYHFQNIDL